ncbi:MAG: hypothetical protein ACQKBY_03860 [Verrucomicrobiales bacterium]
MNPESTGDELRPEIRQLADFPEKLGPVLVKELRQGLRTHAFTLLLSALLLGLTLATLAFTANNRSGQSDGSELSTLIFTLYGLTALILQPLRGLTALSSESKARTIDLLLLTRLTSWRIAFGKWSSLFTQTLLLLSTILPFLIMRYFLGGMNLAAELFTLVFLTYLSAIFTALAIGLSGHQSTLLRFILPALFLFLGLPLLINLFSFIAPGDLFDLFTGSPGASLLTGTLAFFLGTLYLAYHSLENGAASIAPPAENLATRRRLTAAAYFLLGILPLAPHHPTAFLSLSLILISLLAFDLLEEANFQPAPVCRSFLRFHTAGRLLGRLLYPGWATGTLYLLLLLALTLLALRTTPLKTTHLPIFLTISGHLLLCALASRLLATRYPRPRALILILTIASFLISFLLTLQNLTTTSSSDITHLPFVPLPLTQLNILYDENLRAKTLLPLALVNLIYLLLLAPPLHRALRAIRQHEENATG